MRFSLGVVLVLVVGSHATAQERSLLRTEPDSFAARLAEAEGAAAAGKADLAADLFHEARRVWGADGRALFGLAELALADEAWLEADHWIQAGLFRALDANAEPTEIARGWELLGRARAEQGETVEAFEAWMRAHELSPRPRTARRMARLDRTARGAGEAPLGAAQRMARRYGEKATSGPCETMEERKAAVEAERGEPLDDEYWQCERVQEWQRDGVRWVVASVGDWASRELTLWAETADGWLRFHRLGDTWNGAFGGEFGVMELAARGRVRSGGEPFFVFDANATVVDHDACDAFRHDTYETHVCTAMGDAPRCVTITRGQRAATGPGRIQLFAPEDAEAECGDGPRSLRTADERPRSVLELEPAPSITVRVGRRGLRLRGNGAPPGLRGWVRPARLWEWAREGQGPPSLDLLDERQALEAPARPEPEPEIEPGVRPDVAEFLRTE